MPNYVYITLDTIAPQNPTISIASGATYTTNQLVTLSIGTSDSSTSNYQIKLWGDVDATYDNNIKSTEATSTWVSYATTKQVKLANGSGTKRINLKLRDDVYNESSLVFDEIILDTAMPSVTTTTPDLTKISKVPQKNMTSFNFSVDKVFSEYKVKVVNSIGATHDTGTLLGTANGSVNISGNTGNYDTSSTPITVQINGTDLELASSGDGQKIVKVFVKDLAGNWSV